MRGNVVERKNQKMNIYKAVKKALKKGSCIALRDDDGGFSVLLNPVNEYGTIFDYGKASHGPFDGWQPQAKDLMNRKWIVVDQISTDRNGRLIKANVSAFYEQQLKKGSKTINEIRIDNGLEPISDEYANCYFRSIK